MEVLDVIQEDYKTWTPGIYLINAPTGKGKTQFILNQLYDFAQSRNKRIAMFINRIILEGQLEQNLNSKDIDIYTYQKLEFKNYLNSNIPFSLPLYKDVENPIQKIDDEYDYLVLDEIHYIFEDSSFNSYTDTIMKCIKKFKGIVIMMTATANLIKKFYHNRIKKEYYIKPDYSYIQKIVVFNNDDEFKNIFSGIPQNEKSIYFGKSIDKMRNLQSRIPDSELVTSSNKSKTKSVKQIILTNQFECHILFSTKVLDNGVNIIDNSLKHIFIDLYDIDTIIQCVGRKRIIGNEKLTLYIKDNPRSFSSQWKLLKESKKILNDYYCMPRNAFLSKYERIKLPNFIDNNLNIIKPIEFGFNDTYNFFTSIISGKTTFIKEIQGTFSDCKITDYKPILIEEFLKQNLMKKYYGIEKEKIIQKIDARKNGRIERGIKKINTYLVENKIPFEIISKRESSRKSQYFKKTYWQICSKN